MDLWLSFLIGLITYIAIIFIVVRERKAVFIGIVEFFGLMVILGGVYLVGRYVFRVEVYQAWYSVIAIVLGVGLKAWLRPAYRLKDGFLYRDKPYRRSEYPKAKLVSDVLIMFNQKQAKREDIKSALQVPLNGPLKKKNLELIRSLYPDMKES